MEAHLLKTHLILKKLVIISGEAVRKNLHSALGKTTNAFEKIIKLYLKDSDQFLNSINELHEFHIKILNELFLENHAIYKIIKDDFIEISNFFKKNKSPNYNFIYDQIISYGEILSSKILNEYLTFIDIKSSFKDVRELIKTDSYYRNSNINWKITKKNILATNFDPNITVTQGFIASNEDNFTTTMGREASDYTASIFAYCLNANSVTIWKDVDGIFNADPKKFNNTILKKKYLMMRQETWFTVLLLYIQKLFSHYKKKRFLYM